MAEFTYNASALGAGGVIKRGEVTTVIPSIASVALAPTGGRGSSVANYTSPELSMGYVETRVIGEEMVPGQFTTTTYVLVQDLNLFGRLTVGQMGAVVTSTRGMEQEDDHAFELTIYYEKVAVDGIPVLPNYDGDVKGCLRYSDLQQLLATDDKQTTLLTNLGVDAGETQLMESGEELTPKELLIQQLGQGKAVRAPLVRSLTCGGPVTAQGHVLKIPGIGVARFGELMFKPGRRRLNLLRLQLESNPPWFPSSGAAQQQTVQRMSVAGGTEGPNTFGGGSMTIASVEGNGSLLVP